MKPKFYYDIPQHIFDPRDPFNFQTNEDWLALRRDRITASFADELLVNGKDTDGLGKTIKKRLDKRVMQRRSGWIDDESLSWQDREAVRRGIIFEPEAIAWYEVMTGRKVSMCGFVERGNYIGCSPDGLVIYEKRTIQVKVPMPENYPSKIVDDGHLEYVPQCKTELFCTDYDIADLVIYSPELKTGEIIEINRDRETDRKILSKLRPAIRHQDKVDAKISEQERKTNEMRELRQSN